MALFFYCRAVWWWWRGILWQGNSSYLPVCLTWPCHLSFQLWVSNNHYVEVIKRSWKAQRCLLLVLHLLFLLKMFKNTFHSKNTCKFWLLKGLWFPRHLPFSVRVSLAMWLSPKTVMTKVNPFTSQSRKSGIWEQGKIKQQPSNMLPLAFAILTRKLDQAAGDKLKALGLFDHLVFLFHGPITVWQINNNVSTANSFAV